MNAIRILLWNTGCNRHYLSGHLSFFRECRNRRCVLARRLGK